MKENPPTTEPGAWDSGVGLCFTCRHVKRVRSVRGSVFYLCRLSETDSRFDKYPRLPVLQCPGFEPGDEEESN